MTFCCIQKCGKVIERYFSKRVRFLCYIVLLSDFVVLSYQLSGGRHKWGLDYNNNCHKIRQLGTYTSSSSRRTGLLSMSTSNHLETKDDMGNNRSLYPQVIVPHDYQAKASPTSCALSGDWIQVAAMNLEQHGVCALVGGSRGGDEDNYDDALQSLIDPYICDRTNDAALSRLDELQQKIRNRGVDPTGKEDGPFRFREVVCRDEGGRRYDMPVHWFGHNDNNDRSPPSSITKLDLGTPMNAVQTEAMKEFHSNLDLFVQPVMNALWSRREGFYSSDDCSSVAAAGFLINKPGSKSQGWHRDGPDEGYIDVFVPLVDLKDDLGPTRLLPGTHISSDEDVSEAWLVDDEKLPKVVPLLRKGQILLFDYRTLHKGQGNTSTNTTRALAYCVYTRQSSSDIQNFPDALTLEYD